MKKSISFIWVLTLLSGPVSASAFTAVKDTLPSIPENIIIFMYGHRLRRMKKKTMMK